MASFLYDAYRNSVIGKVSDYSARVNTDSDSLSLLFKDDGAGTSSATTSTVFQGTLTTGENPAYAAREAVASSAVGGVVGGLDAADAVFDGGSVLTGSTEVEALICFKDGPTNASDAPLLARWDSTGATGLPLTPNGAAVTVVWNASGLWRF